MPKHTWTLPELMALADRMIGYSTTGTFNKHLQLKADCRACGMILAYLLLKEVIAEAIILSGDGDGSPSIVPEQ